MATAPRLELQTAAPIEALLFDAGDVLFDATIGRRRLLRMLARIGLHAHYDPLFTRWEQCFLPEVYRGRRAYSEAFRDFLQSIGVTPAQADELQAATGAHRRPLERADTLLAGVADTLAQPALTGRRLGVLTNAACGGDALAEHFERIGLAGRFHMVYTSIDLAAHLPDRDALHRAAEALGAGVEQIVYVGHDRAELAAACDVGMRTIAFNHAPGAAADATIVLFQELPNVVTGMAALCAATR